MKCFSRSSSINTYLVWKRPNDLGLRVLNEGARSDQGCFETAKAAKAYIKKVSHEHPERPYMFEECKHREHQH
jgi:hypothetical protein